MIYYKTDRLKAVKNNWQMRYWVLGYIVFVYFSYNSICIINYILECPKSFMKIAFVGGDKYQKNLFKIINKNSGTIISFFNDYEKAKEWVLKMG